MATLVALHNSLSASSAQSQIEKGMVIKDPAAVAASRKRRAKSSEDADAKRKEDKSQGGFSATAASVPLSPTGPSPSYSPMPQPPRSQPHPQAQQSHHTMFQNTYPPQPSQQSNSVPLYNEYPHQHLSHPGYSASPPPTNPMYNYSPSSHDQGSSSHLSHPNPPPSPGPGQSPRSRARARPGPSQPLPPPPRFYQGGAPLGYPGSQSAPSPPPRGPMTPTGNRDRERERGGERDRDGPLTLPSISNLLPASREESPAPYYPTPGSEAPTSNGLVASSSHGRSGSVGSPFVPANYGSSHSSMGFLPPTYSTPMPHSMHQQQNSGPPSNQFYTQFDNPYGSRPNSAEPGPGCVLVASLPAHGASS